MRYDTERAASKFQSSGTGRNRYDMIATDRIGLVTEAINNFLTILDRNERRSELSRYFARARRLFVIIRTKSRYFRSTPFILISTARSARA